MFQSARHVLRAVGRGGSTADLEAFAVKGDSDSKTSTLERDAGFCSGGDEEDLEADDTSDDGVESKAPTAAKNKRKSAEPRKVSGGDSSPYKKRKHLFVGGGEDARVPVPPLSDYSTASDTPPSNPRASLSPFRPWSNPVAGPASPPPPPYTERVPAIPQQDEPLSLVLRRAEETPPRRPRRRDDPAPLPHPRPRPDCAAAAGRPNFTVESLLGGEPPPPPRSSLQPRNYKNMTRERRIEANARERTRVHTISAAFDTLRHSIPAYSHNQKLSKLSVLRIACSYILTLSRVAGMDYSADQSQPSVSSCVEQVGRTIQTEGKLRRKKDD